MTMTVSITCDDCGLSTETSTSYDAGANEIDGVLDEGWHHEGETDLCPSCADEAVSRRIERISDYPGPADLDDDEADESVDDCSACDAPLSSCARDAACCGDCTHGANFAPRPDGR